MNRCLVYSSAVAGLLIVAGQAQAKDLQVRFEIPMLGYTSTETKLKADGAPEVKSENSTLVTAERSDIEIRGSYKGLNLSVWPLAAKQRAGVTYDVMKNLEIGGILGIASGKEEEGTTETETNDLDIILQGRFTAELSRGLALEAMLRLGQETAKSETTAPDATGAKVKNTQESKLTVIEPSVAVVVEIADNFHYVGGLSYRMADGDEESGTGTTTELDRSESSFSVNLATVRYTLD